MKIKESEAVNCAFCDSKQMRDVMDFGQVALAGGFLKLDQIANEQKFTLRIQFCQNCYALQIVDTFLQIES